MNGATIGDVLKVKIVDQKTDRQTVSHPPTTRLNNDGIIMVPHDSWFSGDLEKGSHEFVFILLC